MNLTVVIPGLIWPDVDRISDVYKEASTTHLDKLIRYADSFVIEGLSYSDFIYQFDHSNNLSLANVYADHSNNLSLANLYADHSNNLSLANLYAHKLNCVNAHLSFLLCNPTYLQIDRDKALCTEPELLQLDESETQAIIDMLNQHFHEQLTIYSITDEFWLVGFNQKIQLDNSYPLIDIIGENINPYLQQSNYPRALSQIFNEMQMLLFNCKLNQTRKEEGLLPINSLWFWDKKSNSNLTNFNKIYTNNSELSKANPSIEIIENNLEQILDKSNPLLIWDSLYSASRYRDGYGFISQLNTLDQKLGEFLKNVILNKRTHNLVLLLPHEHKTLKLEIKPINRFKFWRSNNLYKLVEHCYEI